MQTIALSDYVTGEAAGRLAVETNPEAKLKSILDSSSKNLLLSTVYSGQDRHFLLPVIQTERFNDDPSYLIVRYLADLPAVNERYIFKHIGLVAHINGLQKLVWRERCTLTNTQKSIHFDIPLFSRMDGPQA